MRFNIDDLKKAKYGNFVRNEDNLIIACSITDSLGNVAYMKNLVWEDKTATSWMLQDTMEKPSEILVMEQDKNKKISIIQTITALVYNEENKASSFTKTDAIGRQFIVYDIKYDEKDRIIYCKQKDQSGTEREYSDFVFDEKGKFVTCKSIIVGECYSQNISNHILKNAYRHTDIKTLLENLSGQKIDKILPEERDKLLKLLTAIVQILDAIRSNKINDFQNNMEKSDIMHPKYKLVTPLLQVFYSMDSLQTNIIGEKNLDKILTILQNKTDGVRNSDYAEDHVLVKIAGNLSKILLEKVYEGNYHLTEGGQKILNLGFSLKAEDKKEAIELALRHLYYNAEFILSTDEILPYHYKKLDNFLLVKL